MSSKLNQFSATLNSKTFSEALKLYQSLNTSNPQKSASEVPQFKVSTALVFRNSFKVPERGQSDFAVEQISKLEKVEDLLNKHPDDKDSLEKFL